MSTADPARLTRELLALTRAAASTSRDLLAWTNTTTREQAVTVEHMERVLEVSLLMQHTEGLLGHLLRAAVVELRLHGVSEHRVEDAIDAAELSAREACACHACEVRRASARAVVAQAVRHG